MSSREAAGIGDPACASGSASPIAVCPPNCTTTGGKVHELTTEDAEDAEGGKGARASPFSWAAAPDGASAAPAAAADSLALGSGARVSKDGGASLYRMCSTLSAAMGAE